jgi:hypothetical protein
MSASRRSTFMKSAIRALGISLSDCIASETNDRGGPNYQSCPNGPFLTILYVFKRPRRTTEGFKRHNEARY